MDLREELGRAVAVDRSTQTRTTCPLPVPRVTMADVATHNTLADLWIVVEDRAYDVTRWVKMHPGGWGPLLALAGRDATDAFTQFHPASVWLTKLPWFHCANVTDSPLTPEQRDFRALHCQLLHDGLFETRIVGYYLPMLLWCLSLAALAIGMTVLSDGVAGRMLGAVCLGCYFQQMAFVGHDLGHNAVTHDRATDMWLCQVNLFVCACTNVGPDRH